MIRLVIHLQELSEDGSLVWWAESPDLPGFSASDVELQSLLVRTRWAVDEAYPELAGPEFTYEVASEPPTNMGEPVTLESDLVEDGSANPGHGAATARLVTAGA
jgi:hypothetical protein